MSRGDRAWIAYWCCTLVAFTARHALVTAIFGVQAVMWWGVGWYYDSEEKVSNGR